MRNRAFQCTKNYVQSSIRANNSKINSPRSKSTRPCEINWLGLCGVIEQIILIFISIFHLPSWVSSWEINSTVTISSRLRATGQNVNTYSAFTYVILYWCIYRAHALHNIYLYVCPFIWLRVRSHQGNSKAKLQADLCCYFLLNYSY